MCNFITAHTYILTRYRIENKQKAASLATEKKALDAQSDKHIQLVERERTYYKTAKEFEDECKRNELLLAKLGGGA